MTERRDFINKSLIGTSGIAIGGMGFSTKSYASIIGASESVNIAVIGIRNRGKAHYQALAQIPNVNIVAICDIDQRLFPEAVAEIEKLTGRKPAVETEYRKILENKDIDAVSIATPNHWHALQTIWACQAGKDVYVEKPATHNIYEGKKMIEAAYKYNRIVQHGVQLRSSVAIREAVKHLEEGLIGRVYMSVSYTHLRAHETD